MDRKAYQKVHLEEFNSFDTERTLRENIYDLEQQILYIKKMVIEMVDQQMPVEIILNWMRQIEDNAAEIVYVTSLVQHDLNSYNFTTSSFYRKVRGAQ